MAKDDGSKSGIPGNGKRVSHILRSKLFDGRLLSSLIVLSLGEGLVFVSLACEWTSAVPIFSGLALIGLAKVIEVLTDQLRESFEVEKEIRKADPPSLQDERPARCQRCGRTCVGKENHLKGPLEGELEWLCVACYNIEGLYRHVKWKSSESEG